jgi:hypothetical protein
MVPARRQATQPGGIGDLKSILELLGGRNRFLGSLNVYRFRLWGLIYVLHELVFHSPLAKKINCYSKAEFFSHYQPGSGYFLFFFTFNNASSDVPHIPSVGGCSD